MLMVLCRNKVVMNNTISKLERKINELNEQLEEEHKISNEQKDLVHFTKLRLFILTTRWCLWSL